MANPHGNAKATMSAIKASPWSHWKNKKRRGAWDA